MKKLEGGDRRSLGRSAEVVRNVLRDPSLFEAVFGAMQSSDPAIRIRAADAVEKITRQRPDLLVPFQQVLVERLALSEHAEVRWHVAQMLPRLQQTSAAVTILTGYLGDRSRIVQTFALQGLADLAASDAVLREDIQRMLEKALTSGSPAVRSRARKLLNR